MLNINTIKKLDTETQGKIFAAQMEELLERRGVQDPRLFRYCFEEEATDGATFPELIEGFKDIAGEAFKSYHSLRAKGATIDAETSQLVIPADSLDDEVVDEIEDENADDDQALID